MAFFDDKKKQAENYGNRGRKDPLRYGFTQGGAGGNFLDDATSGNVSGVANLLDDSVGQFTDFFQGAIGAPGTLNEETSQNELFKQVGKKTKMAPTDPEGKARWAAFHGALGDLKRRRSSLTTLTSGIGAMGTPGTTAVSSLLGF